MHFSDQPAPAATSPSAPAAFGPWWRELNRYHWFVFLIASLGWMFDTMDQQLFVLARTPALTALLDGGPSGIQYGGGAAAILGTDWTTGGVPAFAKLLAVTELLQPGRSVNKYAGYATAIFILGWATGGLVFGWMSDRWGRARTMMLTILTYSLFTGLSALSRSWLDFAFYRFITGMGVGGEFAAGVALVAEVMPARSRPYALGLLQALSAVGNVTAAMISILLPPQMEVNGIAGWRALFLVGILPALLVVFIFRWLKEPESWLEARKQQATRPMGDVRDLFRERRWRHHTLVGVTLATAGVMGLWGIGFWTPELIRNNVLKDLPKDTQDWYASRALLLQNLAGFFGVYAFTWLTGRVGRRAAFAVSFVVALGATVLVFGFMTQPAQIWWMIPLLGFCGLMVFGGYAIYFPELFPTRLRSTGTGFCYNVARYIAAVGPFLLGTLAEVFMAPAGTVRGQQKLSDLTLLSSMGSVDNAFRYAALTVASIYILGLLALPFAPETKGKPLPQ
jgi:MFS family permease